MVPKTEIEIVTSLYVLKGGVIVIIWSWPIASGTLTVILFAIYVSLMASVESRCQCLVKLELNHFRSILGAIMSLNYSGDRIKGCCKCLLIHWNSKSRVRSTW